MKPGSLKHSRRAAGQRPWDLPRCLSLLHRASWVLTLLPLQSHSLSSTLLQPNWTSCLHAFYLQALAHMAWPPPSRMPLSPTSSHILISPIPPSWCKCAFATKLPWSPQCEWVPAVLWSSQGPYHCIPCTLLVSLSECPCEAVSFLKAGSKSEWPLPPTAPLPSPPAPETPCFAMAVLSEGSVTDSKYAFSLQIPSLIFSSIGYPEALNCISS